MSRPCQNRRASAAAGRNAKKKPAPPVRHKAHQKAIHNARHQRGAGPPNTTASGGKMSHVGSRYNPIALDDDDDSSSLSDVPDDLDDMEMYEAENMVINVDTTRPAAPRGSRSAQGQVMFTLEQALPIYESMRRAGFPLPKHSRTRYEPPEGYVPPNPPSNPPTNSPTHSSTVPTPIPRALIAKSLTSEASVHVKRNTAQDYVFSWGPYKGKHIRSVPERYLVHIGKEIGTKGRHSRHPNIVAAMKHHCPQYLLPLSKKPKKQPPMQPPMQPQRQPQAALPARPGVQTRSVAARQLTAAPALTAPPAPTAPSTRPAPPTRPTPPTRLAPSTQPAQPTRPATTARPPTRLKAPPTRPQRPSETFRFSGGIYAGYTLYEVPPAYLRTLESNKTTFDMWPEFRAALQDFKNKGRRGPA